MANNYRIPSSIEKEIRERDVVCVYCGTEMVSFKVGGMSANSATIEHLDHKPPFKYRQGQTADDFAISCRNCNCVLRRDKELSVWLKEEDAKDGKIKLHTVADVVKKYLQRN